MWRIGELGGGGNVQCAWAMYGSIKQRRIMNPAIVAFLIDHGSTNFKISPPQSVSRCLGKTCKQIFTCPASLHLF